MRIATIVTALALLVASGWERAASLAESGDFAGAEREYRAMLLDDPANPELNYNLGVVLIFAGRHLEARRHLEMARGVEPPVGQAATYNLGNTDLEPAFADPSMADREIRLRRAIEAYKSALLADPDDTDAKWNLEFARRLLEGHPTPPAAGGGGGGGAAGPPMPGEQEPAPAPAGGTGPEPDTAVSEADELLRAAQEREIQIQRESLRKPQPPGPIRP
jgi:tetratricopeptide (TPR) repeat protein